MIVLYGMGNVKWIQIINVNLILRLVYVEFCKYSSSSESIDI